MATRNTKVLCLDLNLLRIFFFFLGGGMYVAITSRLLVP